MTNRQLNIALIIIWFLIAAIAIGGTIALRRIGPVTHYEIQRDMKMGGR